ncbi:MAG TPA: sulfate ABC transporter substrate-binding protein [Blastocatellia bacterium]|nr:sulfate ABC transporter substrate-binding protein [Blastocatellia bacterium]
MCTFVNARSKQWTISLAAAVLLLAAVLGGCSGSSSPSSNRVVLVLGGYTTPREVYGKAIIPAFKQYWKQKTGQDVEFRESYQGSGAQSRAIIGGFEADIAALSLEDDINRIAQAGLITHDWKAQPNNGIVSTSIVVIAVRDGNPKGIKDWADLAAPGLNVLTPDPKTSGGAQWNVNAIYGAALRGYAGVPKDDRAAAQQFLESVFRNVSVMDKGARESLTTFEKGVGDAAITYENEVIVARQAGLRYDYVVPRSTILIQNPVALVDKNVDKHGVREAAEAFVGFLWGEEAQRAFAKYGLRPVDQAIAAETTSQLPHVEDLWIIEFLGGWKSVATDIYGPDGVYSKVIANLRGSK